MKSFLKPVIVICCISFLFTGIKAQNSKPANDTTYYITYPKKLIVTPFLTKDHSKFSLTTPGATIHKNLCWICILKIIVVYIF